MAGDECADVRVAVAKALDVDPEALRVLGADGRAGGAQLGSGESLDACGGARDVVGGPLSDSAGVCCRESGCGCGCGGGCSGDRSVRVRHAVAGRVDVAAAVLQVLATDPKPDVRAAVAANPAAASALLEGLALDGCERVRAAVGGNESAPTAVLEALASDEWWWLRSAVASNLAAGAHLLEALAADQRRVCGDIGLLRTRRRPRSCWRASLRTLTSRCAPAPPATCRRRPRVLDALAGDACEHVRFCAAANASLPPADAGGAVTRRRLLGACRRRARQRAAGPPAAPTRGPRQQQRPKGRCNVTAETMAVTQKETLEGDAGAFVGGGAGAVVGRAGHGQDRHR